MTGQTDASTTTDAANQTSQPDPTAGTGEQTTDTTDDAKPETGDDTKDISGLLSALDKERTARKELSKTVRDLEAQLKKVADSGKSEEEVLRDELETAKQAVAELTETLIRSAIETAALKQGAIDPDLIATIVDRDEIQVDGVTVTGAEDAVKAVLAAKPFLVAANQTPAPPAPGTQDGGVKAPPAPAPDLDQQIAAAEKAGDIREAMRLKGAKLAQLATSTKK